MVAGLRVEVVVTLANSSNFICDHASFCHPNCYERQRRSCVRLMTAIKQVYNAQPPQPSQHADTSRSDSAKDSFKDKMKRRVAYCFIHPVPALLYELFCAEQLARGRPIPVSLGKKRQLWSIRAEAPGIRLRRRPPLLWVSRFFADFFNLITKLCSRVSIKC